MLPAYGYTLSMDKPFHSYPIYPACYRLRLHGRVNVDFTDWVANPVISMDGVGPGTITIITGKVNDQAALFGLLSFIRDLRVGLISVEYLPENDGEDKISSRESRI